MAEKMVGSGMMPGVVAGVVAVAALVVGWQVWTRATDAPPAAPVAVAPLASAVPVAPAQPPAPLTEPATAAPEPAAMPEVAALPAPPLFDTFRLGDDGIAIVAGQGPGGQDVAVLVDGAEAARAPVDAAGRFAAVFPLDPAPQPRLMTLRLRTASGAEVDSSDSIVVAPVLPVLAATETETETEAEAPEGAAPVATDSPAGVAGTTPPTEGADAPAPLAGAPGVSEPVAEAESPAGANAPAVAEDTAMAEAPAAVEPPVAPKTPAAGSDAPPEVASVDPAPLAPETAPGPAPAPGGAPAAVAEAQAPASAPVPAGGEPAAAPAAVPSAQAPASLLLSQQGVTVLRAPGADLRLVIDSISYSDTGAVQVAGKGGAGDVVRLYLNNAPQLETLIDERGGWRGTLPPVDPGLYTLRADQIDDGGKVMARSETPFLREAPEVLALAQAAAAPRPPALGETSPGAPPPPLPVQLVTVQPGYTLWGIARSTYGRGIEYVKVFEANRSQIRNPDLIYPGQVFSLPQAE